jgi:protein TonB
MDANRTTSGEYQLHDELARFCLPESNQDASRKLAWTNSICILFLTIGLVGARSAGNFREPPPRVDEAVPVVIEPIKPPPSPEVQKVEATTQSQTAAPQVVAVTINTPAINFSVPTIGNLVVPNALAQAPSPQPLMTKPTVLNISSTGDNGDRPQPPYPPMALSENEQGSVGLSMTVDDTGVVTQITLKESSGYPILDRSTQEFIKRHWHILPANGSHFFETTITYKIAVN